MVIAHRAYMGVKIIIDDNVDIYDDVPVRFHKRPRIQKKWRKRFGTKRMLVSSDMYYMPEQQALVRLLGRKFLIVAGMLASTHWLMNYNRIDANTYMYVILGTVAANTTDISALAFSMGDDYES